MYSDDKTTLTTIAMLKKYGVRRIVASPGTRNADFVASCQEDPFFKMYSVTDERGAAYFATGIAFETGEAVVITCTGATASRNYLPALTEAYYRRLPIIMLTVGSYYGSEGFLTPQHIDNSVLPNDTNIGQWRIMGTQAEQEFALNQALTKAIRRPVGPVHIHINTLANSFNAKELPAVNKVEYDDGESLPAAELRKELRGKKIGVFAGSHSRMSDAETKAMEKFAETFDACVFADHSSCYHGRNKILIGQACDAKHIGNLPEIMIDTGGICGIYGCRDLFRRAELWRVSEDGEMRQRHGVLKRFFDCKEITFFTELSAGAKSKTGYYESVKNEIGEINADNLPLSGTLVASILAR
ncbi:MAG: hypothetical protein LBL21_03735 [Rickettsiales bacterium]|jgi:2-succinyl-5-enolpyruvyl-6-hydroxy-3-cyclohexene-1-carboxylate synthase|nr:hypothetical protein [Rickettsiales bacterium]